MKLSAKAQKALDTVIARFKSGDLTPIVDIARIRRTDDAPAASWTFTNQVLAYAQTNSLDCRGYRQWQQAGRQVKRGSLAAFIFAPRTVTKENDDGTQERKLAGFLTIPVFPYQATEGDAETAITYEPRERPYLRDLAERLNIEIRYTPMLDALGSCNTTGSRITLGTEDVKTFFHELAHAIHARINGGELKGGQHEDQETVAEFTATVLMEMYGLGDRSGNAWEYIQSYADNPITAITKALSTIEKVLAFLETN
jgi:antirestriction protein ArdC